MKSLVRSLIANSLATTVCLVSFAYSQMPSVYEYTIAGELIRISLPDTHTDVCVLDSSICEVLSDAQPTAKGREMAIGQIYPLTLVTGEHKLQASDVYGTVSRYADDSETIRSPSYISSIKSMIARLNRKGKTSISANKADISNMKRALATYGIESDITGMTVNEQVFLEQGQNHVSTISLVRLERQHSSYMTMLTNFVVVKGRYFVIRFFVGSAEQKDIEQLVRFSKSVVQSITRLNR